MLATRVPTIPIWTSTHNLSIRRVISAAVTDRLRRPREIRTLPAVAFGDVNFRNFFVVWGSGTLPSTSDLYGQLVQFSTLPQLTITDPAGIPILNGAIDFGNVNTGETRDITFKIRNDGNAPLTITGFSTPQAPFGYQTPIPSSINPGTSYDMILRFAPLASGSFADAAKYATTIISDGGTANLSFTGSGIGANVLNISTASFPDTTINTPYTVNLAGIGGSTPYTWSWACCRSQCRSSRRVGYLFRWEAR